MVTSTNALLTGLYLISTTRRRWKSKAPLPCQCPLGLIPHFYSLKDIANVTGVSTVSMPSRAYTSFLQVLRLYRLRNFILCQCPLGLIPHFYDIFINFYDEYGLQMCQWPLGLIPHFYGMELAVLRNIEHECQCPLGLIPHFYQKRVWIPSKQLQKCQCPLGLIPHFYGTPSKT